MAPVCTRGSLANFYVGFEFCLKILLFNDLDDERIHLFLELYHLKGNYIPHHDNWMVTMVTTRYYGNLL